MNIVSNILGQLEYEKEFLWWEAIIEKNPAHKFWFYISCLENNIEDMLPIAEKTYEEIINNEYKYKEACANSLLKLKNECWLDEDEKEVSKEEFINRLKLESIEVREDGEISIYYADGFLFFGHVIILIVNPDGTFQEADIAG